MSSDTPDVNILTTTTVPGQTSAENNTENANNSMNRYPLIPIPSPPSNTLYDFTDHTRTFSIQMSCIHNVFIRALNSIYYHAPLLSLSHTPRASSSNTNANTNANADTHKKALITALAHYTLTWTHLIHHHHHMEETIVFPFLQPALQDAMAANVAQHRMFSSGVDRLEAYMKSVLDGREAWDGERVREIVEGFGEVLVQHLFDEIPTISPDRLSKLDIKGLNAMMDTLSQSIQSLPLTTGHSMILTHHDIQTCPNWPPAPAPITWIIKNIAYWRHRSYWRFAPYTRYSERQEALNLA